KIFYKKILQDSIYCIGDALRLAKIEMLNQFGANGVYSLFALTNTLIGDPIIKLQIPTKVNLNCSSHEIKIIQSEISDVDDSVKVRIKYYNTGLVERASFNLKIMCLNDGKEVLNKGYKRNIPNFSDSMIVNVPVKGKSGQYLLNVILDPENFVAEIDKSDNECNFTFVVNSKSMRSINPYAVEGQSNHEINFINPILNPKTKSFELEISDNIGFKNTIKKSNNFDTVITKIKFANELNDKRIWVRTSIDNANPNIFSLKVGDYSSYILWDSLSFSKGNFINILFTQSQIELAKKETKIETLSAGFNDGRTALIQVNKQNYIPENTLRGHHVVVFKDTTLEFVKYLRFDVNSGGSEVTNYIKFLDTLSAKNIVAIAVSDDGAIASTELKSKIKNLGSVFIDSLLFRGSWTLIGKKSTKQGTVPEMFSKPFGGRVTANHLVKSIEPAGGYLSSRIGPTLKWKNIILQTASQNDSLMNYDLFCIKIDGNIDTLKNVKVKNNVIDLSGITSNAYPYLQVRANLKSSTNNVSPLLQKMEVRYVNPAELITNYQVVSISKDSLDQGEKANLNFSVYNVGESTASNFKVRVDLVKKDNSKEKLFEQVVDSIQTEKKKDFSLAYTTDKLTGSNQFQINIDTENTVTELYKDNNFYSVPFYVKANNKPASLKLTIDGNDIINGDFISSKPNFKIELNDESLIPIADTTKILLFLNNKRIYFATNTNVLNYNYSSSNPKMVVNYTPTLADGNYTFKVVGKNATDQIIDSTGIVRKFTVKNELQLLNSYNYPNPFKDDTYFTFKLTQIPDELRIIIYTIAGRKIKEIKLNSSELKYDFNRIFWDGRDQDGDLTANGVYLYKIISQKGSEKTEVTEKLAILR
ncbi:MAG: interleukin-like EMT inducer domain-containing protein, partial [Ignavibacteria bacterium]|nr:interleukin-like EMT inducer domain-containing protein [Ignavibacteria bacterium]